MARPETPNRLEARRNAETHFGGSVRALLLPLSGRAATGGREPGARVAGGRGRAGGDRRVGGGRRRVCRGGRSCARCAWRSAFCPGKGKSTCMSGRRRTSSAPLTTHYSLFNLLEYSTALMTDSSSSLLSLSLPAILGSHVTNM